MPTSTVLIPGMHCTSCVSLVKDVSSEFPAIQNVAIDLPSKKVTIEHDDTFNLQKWIEEIEALGETYKVSPL